MNMVVSFVGSEALMASLPTRRSTGVRIDTDDDVVGGGCQPGVMTASTTWRHVGWRGADDARRVDNAETELGPAWLLARGDSVTPAYALTWSLTTVSGWVTETLRVTVDGGTWSRSLTLRRDDSGTWSAEASADGAGPERPPGLVDDAYFLTGALDCDLGLCPFTNTMPILRHRMNTADPAPRQELLMAFVDVPSLAVLPSRQGYSQVAPPSADGISVVRFESLDSTFRSDLTVDPDGLVLDYPQLADRLV
jgi:uncharacterized protein